MKPLFADTSYYAALFNERDGRHAQAIALSRRLRGPCVTTEFVLLELGATMSPARSRGPYVELVHALRGNPAMTIIAASSDLFQRGLTLFGRRKDKDWSLVDCTSCVVMTELGIKEALSTDHHFKQAGFKPLLL